MKWGNWTASLCSKGSKRCWWTTTGSGKFELLYLLPHPTHRLARWKDVETPSPPANWRGSAFVPIPPLMWWTVLRLQREDTHTHSTPSSLCDSSIYGYNVVRMATLYFHTHTETQQMQVYTCYIWMYQSPSAKLGAVTWRSSFTLNKQLLLFIFTDLFICDWIHVYSNDV